MVKREKVAALIETGRELERKHSENVQGMASRGVIYAGGVGSGTKGFDKWVGDAKTVSTRYFADHPLIKDMNSALFHKKFKEILGLLESIYNDDDYFGPAIPTVVEKCSHQMLDTGLPQNSHELLMEIIKSDAPASMLTDKFHSLSPIEDEELRSVLRELQEKGFLTTKWADNVPYIIALNNSAKTYADEFKKAASMSGVTASISQTDRIDNSKVFIVHGHDDGAKEEVARFVEKLGLEAIILHEKPNIGQTIIEKIEKHADVGYAIILYTPCDEGKAAGDVEYKKRARQNVVFEHGFFVAKLGRDHVSALLKDSVEFPSDLSGLLYTPMIDGWKYKIIGEMQAVGYEISKDKI